MQSGSVRRRTTPPHTRQTVVVRVDDADLLLIFGLPEIYATERNLIVSIAGFGSAGVPSRASRVRYGMAQIEVLRKSCFFYPFWLGLAFRGAGCLGAALSSGGMLTCLSAGGYTTLFIANLQDFHRNSSGPSVGLNRSRTGRSSAGSTRGTAPWLASASASGKVMWAAHLRPWSSRSFLARSISTYIEATSLVQIR